MVSSLVTVVFNVNFDDPVVGSNGDAVLDTVDIGNAGFDAAVVSNVVTVVFIGKRDDPVVGSDGNVGLDTIDIGNAVVEFVDSV